MGGGTPPGAVYETSFRNAPNYYYKIERIRDVKNQTIPIL